MERFDVIIVGAGHAGAQAALALRTNNFKGTIALIGNETVAPYDRPSLSKDYLAGKKVFDRIRLRPEAFWDEREISLILGIAVSKVNAHAHEVTYENGKKLQYGALIWAAGGAARKLSCSGHDHETVHYLRNKADSDKLISSLQTSKHVVIIGGGFIGLEAAAVLRSFDRDVTLVEAQDRLLARVAAEPVSRFFENEHLANGVKIHLSTSVNELLPSEGSTCSVHLSDGQVLPADLVIVGVGIEPLIEPLADAGAETNNGVIVDEFCKTTLPDIFCIGDCSILRDGPGIRIESVQNANDQATTAAKMICGTPSEYNAIPWFWSNQYDLRLQTIGLNIGYNSTVLRGSPDDRSFSLIYLRDGVVIAADCINSTKDYVQAKKLIAAKCKIDPTTLGDTGVSLKARLQWPEQDPQK